MWLGDYPRAERMLRDVEKELRRMALAGFLAMLQQNLGYAIFRQGRHAEALDLFAASLDFCAATGIRRLASAALSYRSMVLLEQGDAVGVEREARASLVDITELPLVHACALSPLADALIALGRPTEALEVLGPAVALLDGGAHFEERAINVRLAQDRALRVLDEIEAARAVALAARAELLRTAAKIGDAHLRICFDRVPEHAAIFALAQD